MHIHDWFYLICGGMIMLCGVGYLYHAKYQRLLSGNLLTAAGWWAAFNLLAGLSSFIRAFGNSNTYYVIAMVSAISGLICAYIARKLRTT